MLFRSDAQRKTYILAKNKLVVMPDGLMFMVPTKIMPTVMSPLFSVKTKMRMAAEWFHPPRKASTDETVAEMVERHYGPEMVDMLADPLLSGVYGGEATQLSVRAVLPRFADMPSIEVVLLDRKDLTPAGAGETPIMAIAPAVGNAIFDATGQRLRSLPMAPRGLS